jgi:hypothetical protein
VIPPLIHKSIGINMDQLDSAAKYVELIVHRRRSGDVANVLLNDDAGLDVFVGPFPAAIEVIPT